MRFVCVNWFYCFIMLIMDQESQKTEARNFPTSMTFTKGQNPRWPPKYTYCLIKHFFDFLRFFLIIYKWAWRMCKSIFQILEKIIKNWKSYMPLTKVLFSRMSILFGFFVIEGKTINFFEYIKEQKKLICISSIYILNIMQIE